MPNWDYGNNGLYFITICTQNREYLFGDIIDGKMQLNEMGKLAHKYWNEIPQHFPFVKLDEFVVMPNHTHGILVIDKTDDDASETVETRLIASLPPTASQNERQTSKNTGGITGNKNPMFHKNISRIIRWYKGRVTFEIRKIHADFGWQSRFYDHIIRNNKSYQNMKNYIINNPMNWGKDKFYE